MQNNTKPAQGTSKSISAWGIDKLGNAIVLRGGAQYRVTRDKSSGDIILRGEGTGAVLRFDETGLVGSFIDKSRTPVITRSPAPNPAATNRYPQAGSQDPYAHYRDVGRPAHQQPKKSLIREAPSVTRMSPHGFKPTVTAEYPEVLFTPEVLEDIRCIIGLVSVEVGFLGIVDTTTVVDGIATVYTVSKVVVPKQECHAAETDITAAGLADVIGALENPQDVMRLRLWGHTHPHGSTNPSGQDNTQFESMASGHDFFIRLIADQAGKMSLSLTDTKRGVTFDDIPWDVTTTVQPAVTKWKEVLEVAVQPTVTTYAVARGTSTYLGSTTYAGNEAGRTAAAGWGVTSDVY